MDTYLEVLKRELRPAMGCTEPAASALAGAKAAELLGMVPRSLEIVTSRDMVKNAMGVGIPNCSLKGIQAAVALGASGGDCEKGLSILSSLTKEQIEKASAIPVSLTIESGVPALYIKVIAKANKAVSIAVISGEHDRFSFLQQNDTILRELAVDACGTELKAEDEQFLDSTSLADILQWVEQAPQEAIALVLDAKDTNLVIARHAMDHSYGLSVGSIAAESIGNEPNNLSEAFSLGSAMAAAASDARMAGCPLPVIINSGSGNQGITLTVPLAVVADYLKVPDEK
ncbi:MAG: L-serine ammonia-lyase, iron-sulfur-dependent, subunit alpha, partial [Sphaerochaetaceae bacterium]